MKLVKMIDPNQGMSLAGGGRFILSYGNGRGEGFHPSTLEAIVNHKKLDIIINSNKKSNEKKILLKP